MTTPLQRNMDAMAEIETLKQQRDDLAAKVSSLERIAAGPFSLKMMGDMDEERRVAVQQRDGLAAKYQKARDMILGFHWEDYEGYWPEDADGFDAYQKELHEEGK